MFTFRDLQSDIYKKDDRVKILKKIITANVESGDLLFKRNIKKWKILIAYYKWYPDKWFDLLKSQEKGFDLGLDQRVFLRVLSRFPSSFNTFPRGYSKTMLEVMEKFHTAVFYPNSHLSITAQTKENASKILRDKYEELLEAYPGLRCEIKSASFRNDYAKIIFNNGSTIDILANALSSNGARRHRGNCEEAFLIKDDVFQLALEPIFNVPRRLPIKGHPVDAYELNGQINFFTSAGYKGSAAHTKAYKISEGMLNLTGDIVLGSTWQLGFFYGRGEEKSKIFDKKEKNPKSYFDMNYMGHWVGSTEDGFINTENLIECRVLEECEYIGEYGGEYVLGVDVARSKKTNNNQTSISILKVKRDDNGYIKNIDLVNLITIAGTMSNFAQAVKIKQIKKIYNASVVVVDENGMGVFLVDELCRNTIDPVTNEDLGCFNTIGDDGRIPEKNAETCVYGLFAQSFQNEIVTAFMDLVSSKKLRLLKKKDNLEYIFIDKPENGLPYLQTDFLQDEILNLKIVHKNDGNLTLTRNVKKMDKDRVSSTIYGCWYIMKFMNRVDNKEDNFLEEYSQYIGW